MSPTPGPHLQVPAQASSVLDLTAILVSLLALAFTIGSFWWMNWRQGKLHAWPPRTFAARGNKAGQLVLQLPLVVFNDGPMPKVLRNLRVVLPDEDGKPLSLQVFVDKLATDEGRRWASALPVKGREMVDTIGQFQRTPGDLEFEARKYAIEIQARVGDKTSWESICSFELNISSEYLPQINQSFLAYDNELTT